MRSGIQRNEGFARLLKKFDFNKLFFGKVKMEDKRARRRESNRRAARKSRNKKKNELQLIIAELQYLRRQNKILTRTYKKNPIKLSKEIMGGMEENEDIFLTELNEVVRNLIDKTVSIKLEPYKAEINELRNENDILKLNLTANNFLSDCYPFKEEETDIIL